jgi:putative peptidoglycan lipid II flippase
LLAVALAFTPAVISLLAPGFAKDPGRFTLAVELTRITFPYLPLVSLVTLYGGILNAMSRFAAPAAAPILLNLSMMVTLAVAVLFPTPGHAAAWGVLIAGVLEFLLVGGDALRNGVMTAFRAPRWDEDVKRFFKALVPATIGSAGVQIAFFADTIIASFLSAGALSALYYADRLNQLPIGVIGIAAGTVVVPEMANRIAAGDEAGALRAQARTIELTLLLSIPCLVAFLLLPELIMRALFVRGAFTAADAHAAGQTLAAYAIGLLPYVLIRSVTATFLARGDTATPAKAALTAVAVNVACKIALMGSLAQVGLALATSVGAWLNLGLVVWLAVRAGHLAFDPALRNAAGKLTAAGLALALVLFLAQGPVAGLFAGSSTWHDVATLAVLALVGALVYGGIVLALFGREWLAMLRRRKR